MGLRGEHSLSASLSGTRRSSLPLSDDRLLFAGVIGGGELAATTTSASIATKTESASSTSSSAGRGIPGSLDSVAALGKDFAEMFQGGGESAQASVCRLRSEDLTILGALGADDVIDVDLYSNFRSSVI